MLPDTWDGGKLTDAGAGANFLDYPSEKIYTKILPTASANGLSSSMGAFAAALCASTTDGSANGLSILKVFNWVIIIFLQYLF